MRLRQAASPTLHHLHPLPHTNSSNNTTHLRQVEMPLHNNTMRRLLSNSNMRRHPSNSTSRPQAKRNRRPRLSSSSSPNNSHSNR